MVQREPAHYWGIVAIVRLATSITRYPEACELSFIDDTPPVSCLPAVLPLAADLSGNRSLSPSRIRSPAIRSILRL